MAIDAWNMMDGIDWQAMHYIIESFGIIDVDCFVSRLIAIRENKKARNG